MRTRLTLFYFAGLIALLLFVVNTSDVLAAESVRSVRLDSAAITNGYPLKSPDGRATFYIRPKFFSLPTTVTVTQDDEPAGEAPMGYERMTAPAYRLSSLPSLPQQFAVPLVVQITGVDAFTSIGIQAEPDDPWDILPARMSGPTTLRAELHVPIYAIALFHRQTIALDTLGITSKSAVLYDEARHAFLGDFNGDAQRPIASMTKLISASVFLDTKLSMDRIVTYTAKDARPGASLYVRPGDTMRRRDLFYAMLLGSANNATAALARSTGLTEKEFVRRMNAKATALGLTQTHFVEPTGLDPRNVSTAKEYALLASTLLQNTALRAATTRPSYSFRTVRYRRAHTIKNTDQLLGNDLTVTAGKTGYLVEAGYTMMIQTRDILSRTFITVVLGNPTSRTRFADAKSIALEAENL